MSLAKAIVFQKRLSQVTLESAGPQPIGGDQLKAELEKSFQAGVQSATEKCNAKVLELRQEMQAHAAGVLKRIEEAHAQLTAALSAGLPELIAAGVWKIIGQDSMPAETLKARVETLVKENCPTNEPVEVRMSAEDIESLNKIDAEFAKNHPLLKFIPDETLTHGDCVMETKFGRVDATLKTQMRRMIEELVNT